MKVNVEFSAETIEQLADSVAAILAERHQQPERSPWLSATEAADYLRVSERQLHRLVAQSRIRSATVGRRRVFHRDHLDEMATGEE